MINLALTILNKFFYQNRLYVPNELNQYKLLSKNSTKESANFVTGVFTKQNTKYVLKIWRGFFHDSNYYSLIKEYNMGLTINNYLALLNIKRIRIPKSIEKFYIPNGFVVVFEFIEGEQLHGQSTTKKNEVYTYILQNLKIPENMLKNIKGKIIKTYSLTNQILEILFFLIPVMVTNPKKICTFLLSFIKFNFRIPNIHKQDYILCHGDLIEDNIILSGNTIYLLDWEHSMLAPPQYEVSSLSVLIDDDNLSKILFPKLNTRSNKFMEWSVIIHHLFFAIRSPDEKNKFLLKL